MTSTRRWRRLLAGMQSSGARPPHCSARLTGRRVAMSSLTSSRSLVSTEFVPVTAFLPRLRTALGNRVHSRWGDVSGRRPRSGRARVVTAEGWVFFVGAGCTLHAAAGRMVAESAAAGGADLVYGDSVHFGGDEPGQYVHQLRPGWSPERLRAHCYVGEVLAARPELVDRAGVPGDSRGARPMSAP